MSWTRLAWCAAVWAAVGCGEVKTGDDDDTGGAPSVTGVAITPDPATAADTLTCSYTFSDPDGDADASTIAWTVNGDAAGTGATLADGFTGGDTVGCTVTPFDGTSTGEAASATIVIDNLAPSASDVTISPDPPTAAGALTCSYTFEDPDGGADASSIAWTINGTDGGSGPTLAAGFARGDQVTCIVTPSDGIDTGSPATATVTVDNAPPVIDSIAISPSAPTAATQLACAAVAGDPDGDTPTVAYRWLVGTTVLGTGPTLSSGHARGDVVRCEATANDGFDDGPPGTAMVTIGNAVPSIAGVTITPNPAAPSDTLTCGWSGFADADGDPDLSTVQWRINGAPAGTATTLAGGFASGDTVECAVTPFDGIAAGTPASATMEIGNAPPSIVSAAIAPVPARVADTLTCSWIGYSDPEGDPDMSYATWTVNGTSAGTGTTLAGAFVKGDTVACNVTPFDGASTGTTVSTSTVIANTPPVVSGVTITPDPAYVTSTLTCTYTYTDADGDPDLSTRTWRVNGAVVGTGPTLSSGFAKGDVVRCDVVPNDGTASGATRSDSITISNSPPIVSSVTLSPASAYTNTVITATPTWSDADGDTPTFTYQWRVNGTTVPATGSTLSGVTHFDKGDTVAVTVTPSDGTPGTPASASKVILNTAPGTPGVSTSPSFVTVGDVLTCTVTTPAPDPDGDALTYTFSWREDGNPTGLTGATITTTAPGQWECQARAHDGEVQGPIGSAYRTVYTDACGTIAVDTEWSADTTPIVLTCDTTIASGVKLAIVGEVLVVGDGYSLVVEGALVAEGTAEALVRLDDVSIVPGTGTDPSVPFSIDLSFVDFSFGRLYPATGDAIYGSLNIVDSVFLEIQDVVYLWYPVADCRIERNTFLGSYGFSVGTDNGRRVTFANNVFYQQQGAFAIENWAAYDLSVTQVAYNSFLSTDRIAVRLPPGYANAALFAERNYWNTTMKGVVETMIYDINDDIMCAGEIPYDPILLSPDPGTPDPGPWM